MFRDVVKGVAKNTSIMFFQQMVTWSATFLLMLFLPRYLGPVEYGRLYLANAITAIFRIFVAYGGNYLIAKEVSRAPEDTGTILVNTTAHRFVFAVLSIAGMVTFSFVAGYPGEVRELILIMGLGLLWLSGSSTLQGCYQGLEKMQYSSTGTVVEIVFASVVSVAALLLGASVALIAVIGVIGSLLNFLTLYAISKKVVSSLPRINWSRSIRQIRDSTPYFFFIVFGTIYYRIDTVMLSKMAPEEVVGWYGGGYRLFEVFHFLPYIYSTAVYPALSRLWKQGTETHARTTQKGLELIIIAGIPISVGAIAYAGKVVDLFYGLAGYNPTVLVLQALASGLVFLYINMVLGTTLLSSDRQKHQSLVAFFAIPVNVGLNLLLIPYFQTQMGNGGIGAAIATTLTEICIMISFLYLLPKGILKGFRLSVLVKSSAAALAMAVSIWLMTLSHIPWLLQIPISILFYAVVLWKEKTLEPVEEEFFKSLLTLQSLRHLRQVIRLK